MAKFWYQRDVDSGRGRQTLLVNEDGTVESQQVAPKQGGAYYTGDGNPEVVGRNVKALRGWGFRKDGQADPETWQE
jgi:hypothetical protein